MNTFRALVTLLLLICLAWFSQACTSQVGPCTHETADTCNVPVAHEPDCWTTQTDAGYAFTCTEPVASPGLNCAPASIVDADGQAMSWGCK